MVGLLFNRERWRYLYPFASQYLHLASGARMHYLDEGQGEPIVCVHGNPTWSFYYRRLVQDNRETRRVIVPDHIGCGLSDKPQQYNYTLQQHIANLEELLDTLRPEPFTLVVHDWGGPIGLGYAVRHPEMVKRLLILNTAAFRSQQMYPGIALARVPVLGDLLVRGLNAFLWGSFLINTKHLMENDVYAGYLYPYSSWSRRIGILRFVQDIPLKPSDTSYGTLADIEDHLDVLQDKPISFVWGGLDRVFNDHFLAEWQRRFPKAKFTRLDNAGHWITEDAPLRIQHALTQLLEEEHVQI